MSGDDSIGSGSFETNSIAENERIVGAIAAGDREAERAFASRYMRSVRAMLRSRLRNPEIVADLLQDVLIEAICALRRGNLRDPSKLTQFVLGIARNVLNSHFRNAIRQPVSLEMPESLPDLSDAAADAEEQEREALAMHAISNLESVDRTILLMTLVEGLKPGVIAQRLNMSADVVRQRKVRATRRVIDFVQRRSQKDLSAHFLSGQER
jgi:RNA polymerase sigma factor (sigma-70 family)